MLKLSLILQIRQTITKRKQKVIGLTEYKLGAKIMTTFAGLRVKIYNYLIEDFSKNKKAKDTKTCHKSET